MRHSTAGAALMVALADHGMTLAQWAESVGVSLRYAHMIVSGERLPSLAMAVRIYRTYKVSPLAWARRNT